MNTDENLLFLIAELYTNTKSKFKEAKCSEGDCGGDGKHILKKVKSNT